MKSTLDVGSASPMLVDGVSLRGHLLQLVGMHSFAARIHKPGLGAGPSHSRREAPMGRTKGSFGLRQQRVWLSGSQFCVPGII